jgi:shikimate kinase
MKIFLIGMMGSGKTTIGRMLADKLAYSFSDTDLLIENKEEMKVADIFKYHGEARFRRLEAAVLRNTGEEHIVVATGGGLPCHASNLKWMLSKGVVIYLQVSVDVLTERLKSEKDRPLLSGLMPDGIKSKLSLLLNQRSKFYEKAHFTLGAEEMPATIVDKIKQMLSVDLNEDVSC